MTKGFARWFAPGSASAALLTALTLGPLARGSLAQSGERGSEPEPRGTRGEDAITKTVVEEMTRYTTPGPRHKELAALAGAWTTLTRVWEKPGAKPFEFKGAAEYRVILGGRFVQLDSRSVVNGVENRGLGIYGYDAFKEKYTFYYVHDGETQALTGLGDRDSTGAVTFAAGMDMPATGERAKPIRIVLRNASTGRHTFEIYERYLDDREWKVLEIAYDRAR